MSTDSVDSCHVTGLTESVEQPNNFISAKQNFVVLAHPIFNTTNSSAPNIYVGVYVNGAYRL